MIVLHLFAAPLPSCTTITCSKHFSHDNHFVRSSTVPRLSLSHVRTRIFLCSARNRQKDLNGRDFSIDIVKEDQELEDDGDDGFLAQGMYARRDAKDIDEEEAQENEDDDSGYSGRGPYTGRPGKDYDRDPELGNILGSFLEDPQAAQSKLEDRLRKKRSKILHTKTGSGKPMKVSFNKTEELALILAIICPLIVAWQSASSLNNMRSMRFSSEMLVLSFKNTVKVFLSSIQTIRAWHIIGRLGGCNAMNMQLSQSPMDARPSYDYIQGANVEPTTFYNIGDLELQDNLARIWLDIGTVEPLLLDVLINALTQISSDFVGIKQVMFGGSEFENWNDSLKSEDAGYGVHKI
ncbi:hypothetical protein HKD37_09G024745 [Glycine soja]